MKETWADDDWDFWQVPFKVVDREDRLWTIETLSNEGERVDLNYRVVGFAVRDRLRSAR